MQNVKKTILFTAKTVDNNCHTKMLLCDWNCQNTHTEIYTFFSFFIWSPLVRWYLFWPPSMVYISVIITQLVFHSISAICQSAEYILELYIRIDQLLILTEKFSPFMGFEPGTSSVPSRYATNPGLDTEIYTVSSKTKNQDFLAL